MRTFVDVSDADRRGRTNASVMGEVNALFSRKYRAALLDYLLHSGEFGRQRAYELGRRAMKSNVSLLHILRVHQQAVDSMFAGMRPGEDGRRLKASEEFLMEMLSTFDMTNRGYVDLIDDGADRWRRHRQGH